MPVIKFDDVVHSFHKELAVYSVCTTPLSFPQTPFSRSLSSTICNPEHPHPMRMLWITNGEPERAIKRSLGKREGRSCKHKIAVLFFSNKKKKNGRIFEENFISYLPLGNVSYFSLKYENFKYVSRGRTPLLQFHFSAKSGG